MKSIVLVAAAVAGSLAASPCADVDRANGQRLEQMGSSKANECKSMGCRWRDNRCREPEACEKTRKTIKYLGANTGLTEVRKSIDSATASLCDEHPECSSWYEVRLNKDFTSGPPNCNDMGMLPPHGRNQRECTRIEPELFTSIRGLNDYVAHPFPEDRVKQNVAVKANAVTAIFEDTTDCTENEKCAFPLGYMTDHILKGKSVCLEVFNADDKWVEIMAASRMGSSGGSYCVADWDSEGEDTACTKEGDLYQCRESGNTQFGDSMKLRFFAQDNIDDANIEFYFRIAASRLPPGKTGVEGEEKDAEDWCQFRDSADYPMSLMNPYPNGFDGLPVFQQRKSAASVAGLSGAVVAAVAFAYAHLLL
jgi:hypothetical protein